MKKKILVVDDDPAVRHFMRRVLQGEYEVVEAGDGDEAAKMVAALRPDLVVLDMHMPRLDGIAALSEILDIDAAMPVIMVTGDGDMDRAKLAMDRGARDFMTKPFDLQTLQTSVMPHLAVAT